MSSEQPSIIDDPEIKNAFYNAPTVCAIFAPDNFVYGVPDAYCCAGSMVLMATALGIASCIIVRGKETLATPEGKEFLKKWVVLQGYSGCCFVLLRYCNEIYPDIKLRKPNRYKIIE